MRCESKLFLKRNQLWELFTLNVDFLFSLTVPVTTVKSNPKIYLYHCLELIFYEILSNWWVSCPFSHFFYLLLPVLWCLVWINLPLHYFCSPCFSLPSLSISPLNIYLRFPSSPRSTALPSSHWVFNLLEFISPSHPHCLAESACAVYMCSGEISHLTTAHTALCAPTACVSQDKYAFISWGRTNLTLPRCCRERQKDRTKGKRWI